MELEIIMVRTVLINIGPLLISGRILVNSLPIQPFIERAAVIKNAVQNDLHASSVRFLHDFCKKPVACFQILFIGNAVNISGGKSVLCLPVFQQISLIMYNFTKMRIYIVIVLNIILMVGR